MQRDDDAGPRRRAREVKDNAASHVALQGGKECPGRGRAVDCGTDKRGGGAALVERARERGIGEADVVPVKPGNGHRRLIGGLRQKKELVKAGR